MLSQDTPTFEGFGLEPTGWGEDESFFRELLGDMEEPSVAFGLLEAQGDDTGSQEARLEVDLPLSTRLRKAACAQGVTVESLCHLAWALVMARASGNEDVVFGTVLYGSGQVGTHPYRVLPMRLSLAEDSVQASSFRTHALLSKLMCVEGASLALAQSCSKVPASVPLFTALLDYRPNQRIKQVATDDLRSGPGTPVLCAEGRTDYPLTILVEEAGESFRFTARVLAAIDATRVCRFMHTSLVSLVEALEVRPSAPVHTLNVLPDAERQMLLYGWNDTRIDYPENACIHELFEEQVAKTPDALALVGQDGELSYIELNRRANRLAHRLRALCVQPDSRVAICMERGFGMVVALLAVLKAGGTYVPLDPTYPVDRLRFMLQDSAPVVLLAEKHLESLFPEIVKIIPVIHLDAGTAVGHGYPDTNLIPGSIGLSPTNLAYVIYTSGSTGTPKGVMCEHRGLCNLTTAQIRDFSIEPDSRVLQFASFSFDACVSEVMTTLCRGASLCIGAGDKKLAGEALEEVVAQYDITHATLPPAVLTVMSETGGLDSVRTLILAGEALTGALVTRWAPGRQLINAYGPTESTICATVYQCEVGKFNAPPIGRPIANTKIYILDKHNEPAPVGVAGEMYIGGVGVARGYLNRTELTAEKFVPDPFTTEPGGRMYRTGDLGRWLADGNIEFLGRNDFQVKIRGFRIELGEIEAKLAEHPGVREAVVMAREDTPGDKRLVAYYSEVDANGTREVLDTEGLRAHLSAQLPEFMVPAAYVRLQSLPLTANGKLDRKALPSPGRDSNATRHYEPPIGGTETALAEIWAEFLKLDRIGRRDSFFELGGDSLLAARMIARLRASFQTRLPLFSFIQTPTIAYLADLLAGHTTHMAVVNKGSSRGIPLMWVAPEPWQPHLTSYLSGDQPVFSFVLTQEELASTAPYHRLEDLAAFMVGKIRTLHPSSAYVLTGFCQTSLLAYECAQQLKRLGHEIPLLIMGDALRPGYLKHFTFAERWRRRLDRELFYLSVVRRSRPSQWKQLLRQRVGGFRAMLEKRVWEKYYHSNEKSTGLVEELYQALLVAHLGYVPEPYHGRVLYLQSSDRPQSSRLDAATSWQGLIEEMEVFEAPGDHTSIFRGAHVKVTAERIQQALDSVR